MSLAAGTKVGPYEIAALLAAAVLVVVAVALFVPRVEQDPSYHDFADRRPLFGIPNGLDVVSNLPFALVGLMGLRLALGTRPDRLGWERWPYVALFGATLLVSVGSAYYHLAPDNPRLFWDRLPMAVAFMGLLTAVIAERVGVRAARALLVPLLLLGAASVLHWHWTESRGAGDLRFYALVQFGSLLVVILLVALVPARYPGTALLVGGLVLYGGAKLLEAGDDAIFRATGAVSGHTLKHVVSALAVGCVAAALRARVRSR